MKNKIYLIAIIILLTIAWFPTSAAAFTDDKMAFKEAAAHMTAKQRRARIEEIKSRVEEIRAMDKLALNRQEKKELKAELKSLRHEASAMGAGGIYLSLGAVLLVILIVILLL